MQTHITPVELGGHIAKIMKVEEMKSRNGKDMIKVFIDFDQQDNQRGYFSDRYKADTRDDKKWPFNATAYIMAEDSDGNCSRNLKAFNTAYEESNGATIVWGDSYAAQFNGKKIGVVYGEEEDYYRDELRTSRKIRYFCDASKALDQEVPAKKFYKGDMGTSTTTTSGDNFMDIPDDMDGLPFN